MKAKTHLSQNKSRGGFTLVEMLVVIGMIAALAGLSFPVYRGIQKKVDKTKFEMMLGSLERAVDNFETEYNYLPYIGSSYPASDTSFVYKSESGHLEDFFSVLVAPEGASAAVMGANFKRIRFFECQEAEGGPGSYENGLLVTNTTATLYTPWGDQYKRLRLDYSGDGKMVNPWATSEEHITKIMLYDWGPDDSWGARYSGDWDDNFSNTPIFD